MRSSGRLAAASPLSEAGRQAGSAFSAAEIPAPRESHYNDEEEARTKRDWLWRVHNAHTSIRGKMQGALLHCRWLKRTPTQVRCFCSLLSAHFIQVNSNIVRLSASMFMQRSLHKMLWRSEFASLRLSSQRGECLFVDQKMHK